MADFATRLADIEVRDPEDRAVRIGTAWETRPAVLVFIRHFG